MKRKRLDTSVSLFHHDRPLRSRPAIFCLAAHETHSPPLAGRVLRCATEFGTELIVSVTETPPPAVVRISTPGKIRWCEPEPAGMK